MAGFSAFHRFGNGFTFSSRKPLGRKLYEQIVASYGGVYQNTSFSGPFAARSFALAMTVARARTTLERAANQADPLKVYDLLTAKEREYSLAPGPNDTLYQRRQALAAAMKLPLGPRRTNVEYQLSTLLGSDYVAFLTQSQTDGTDWSFPSNFADVGIFNDPATWKTVTLDAPITALGSPLTIHYTHVTGDSGSILVGDRLVVQPGDLGQQEAITVTARTDTTLTTTFTRPHESGVQAIRRPWPFWLSAQMHCLVVVKNGRATDPVLRRNVFLLLHKLLGATASWDVVEENATPHTTGPFLPGSGLPGITPILQYAT